MEAEEQQPPKKKETPHNVNIETRNKVRVALIQCRGELGQIEANTKNIISLCEEAAANGAKLITLPELAIHGHFSQDLKTTWTFEEGEGNLDPSDYAEQIPSGASCERFSQLAKKLKVYIALPVLEKDLKGKLFDSLIFITPEGIIGAHYRKMNLWRESWAGIGTKTEWFDTEYGRVGFAIGNDFNHVLDEKHYGQLHLWALIWSSSWVTEFNAKAPQNFFQRKVPDLIQDKDMDYVLFTNWSSNQPDTPWYGYGYSSVYGPKGKIIACADGECGSEIVYADITPNPPYPKIPVQVNEKKVKVACLQMSSDLGTTEQNCKKIEKLCIEAAKNGAKILVLPEAAVTGYLSQDLKTNWHLDGWPITRSAFPFSKDPGPYAQTVDGPVMERFCKLAKELQVYITVPFVEVDKSEDHYYNTVCLVSPEGKMVAHYRKNNPWPHPEWSWATAGVDIACYDTEYGRVGLAICFDIHSILKKYEPEKLWALLYPIAWVGGPMVGWFHDALPNSKLKHYNHHVVGCNWSVDKWEDWVGYGYSTIYLKNGQILSTAKSIYGEEIIYGELPVDPKAKKSSK